VKRPEIDTACVIEYPYLWNRESEAGETEGRKNRSVAVSVRMSAKMATGEDKVVLFPITPKEPVGDQVVFVLKS
jgi:hypothetical protein